MAVRKDDTQIREVFQYFFNSTMAGPKPRWERRRAECEASNLTL